ncbi:MAG: hypothetical protein A2W26_04350 [Acidobacteria bacterium RBG_16_64_8]|nr:MAG: hypothetical protein A2W26_04350 [Acidobacteria bacterium RBG_16_64_8]
MVTQGLKVYLIRNDSRYLLNAGADRTIPAISNCDDAVADVADRISSSIVIDRWELEFGGAAIVTCTRQTDTTTAVWEAWSVKVGPLSNGTISPTVARITQKTFLATGRPDITSPNFATPAPAVQCGGCIAVVPDFAVDSASGAPYVALIDGSGATRGIVRLVETGIPSPPGGRKHALTIPARFRNFDSSGACLFGTAPSNDSILKFGCTDVFPQSLMGFTDNPGPGDLLIFVSADGGSAWLVNVDPSTGTTTVYGEVHPGVGVYEDLSFSPVKQVLIQVGRTSQDDPNPGGNTGKIKFYILTRPGFNDPLAVIVPGSLRFGATGTEQSNVSCKNVGTNVNDDVFPDPMCEADATLAHCDFPLVCILTGLTENPSAFEGGD